MEYLNFSAACARTFENKAMLTIMKRAMANRFDWMHILMSFPFLFGSGDCSVSATAGFFFLVRVIGYIALRNASYSSDKRNLTAMNVVHSAAQSNLTIVGHAS